MGVVPVHVSCFGLEVLWNLLLIPYLQMWT